MRAIEAVTGCLDSHYAYALTQLLKLVIRRKCSAIETDPAALELMVNDVTTTLFNGEFVGARNQCGDKKW